MLGRDPYSRAFRILFALHVGLDILRRKGLLK